MRFGGTASVLVMVASLCASCGKQISADLPMRPAPAPTATTRARVQVPTRRAPTPGALGADPMPFVAALLIASAPSTPFWPLPPNVYGQPSPQPTADQPSPPPEQTPAAPPSAPDPVPTPLKNWKCFGLSKNTGIGPFGGGLTIIARAPDENSALARARTLCVNFEPWVAVNAFGGCRQITPANAYEYAAETCTATPIPP